MKWAKRQQIPSGPLARALDVLAMLVDDNNSTFKSQKTIAGRMRCSLRTVWQHLNDLETLGIIQRSRRSRGRGRGRTSDVIFLRVDQDFIFTRDQLSDVLHRAKSASFKRAPHKDYNSQFSSMQLAENAEHEEHSDQPVEDFYPEEPDELGENASNGYGPVGMSREDVA